MKFKIQNSKFKSELSNSRKYSIIQLCFVSLHINIIIMKNSKNSTLLLIMIGMLLFTACEKEGVFNPKRKIAKTTIAVSAVISGHQIDVPAVDEMTFTWDGSRLDKITYHDYDGEPAWIAQYSYDKKNRIVAIENSDYQEKAEFIYDGNKLSEMNFYRGDDKVVYVEVEHDVKRLSQLSYHINNTEIVRKMSLSPWAFFMDDMSAATLNKKVQYAAENSQTKGEVIMNVAFTWNGDNVEKMSLTSPTSPTDPNMQVDIMFEYDSHANPMLHAYSIYTPMLMSDESHITYSANNMIKYQEVTPTGSTSIDFVYTYDGDYPVTRSYTIYDADDVETDTREYFYQ